jgi:hypothetical protein
LNWFDNTKQVNLCKYKYIAYGFGSNSEWDFMQQGKTREKVGRAAWMGGKESPH